MGGGSDSLHTQLTRRCSDAHELVEMADLGSRLLITLNHSLPSGAIVLGAIIFLQIDNLNVKACPCEVRVRVA